MPEKENKNAKNIFFLKLQLSVYLVLENYISI